MNVDTITILSAFEHFMEICRTNIHIVSTISIVYKLCFFPFYNRLFFFFFTEIYCLIQDYYGMTSLDFCLVTEYSNNPIAISENTVDTSVGYAYGVIEGMAYLDSQQVGVWYLTLITKC